MSREMYLENAQAKTGKSLEQFVAMARARGFDGTTKPGIIVNWLKQEFALGHGYATAVMHSIKSAIGQGGGAN